jgi:uncharacterized protein YjbI with pentapeptide repeats
MANQKHLELLKKGVQDWNIWRKDNQTLRPNLRDANLRDTNLAGIDLRNTYLTRAYLWSANLKGSNLSGAHLVGASLRNANLSNAILTNTNLRNADLQYANFTSSRLNGADLRDSKLYGVDFNGANLQSANLSRADSSKVNFTYANLSGAKLYRVNLTGSNLMNAILNQVRLYETAFINTNLIKAQGLDDCVHRGPSCIDHRTFSQSNDLPLVFLRGCGLPDHIIDNIIIAKSSPIQYYTCFISYSTKDQEFADRLYTDLQNEDIRCWFAPHHIQAGKKIHEQIDHAIGRYDRLLLILSENSMKSEWVKTEIANARQQEISKKKRVLFPIRLVDFEIIKKWKFFDAETGKDSANEIREYFIPDFSNWWDHDAYQNSFNRLLRDLKTENSRQKNSV